MSFDANVNPQNPSLMDIRARDRQSQPSRSTDADKAFEQHLSEKAAQARSEAEARAKADAEKARASKAARDERAAQAAQQRAEQKQPAKNDAPVQDPASTQAGQSNDPVTDKSVEGAEETVSAGETDTPAQNAANQPTAEASEPKSDTPVTASEVAAEPTTQALVQEIAVTAEAPVMEIIAPQDANTEEAGLAVGEARQTKDKTGAPIPESTEDAGLNEALEALKSLVGKRSGETAGSEKTKADQEVLKQAAAEIALAAQKGKGGEAAADKVAQTALSLDGKNIRSIAQKLLDEANALKEVKASQTALARTQEVAASQNAIGNRLAASLEEGVTPVTNSSTSATGVTNEAAQKTLDAAGLAALAEEEAGSEAEIDLASLAKPAKGEAKPSADTARAPSEISAAAKGAPAAQPASGMTPELVVTQKVADVQGLSSTAAKPEVAALPQQSSQAVPIQTVGIHIARQAMAGQTKFDIRLDPPELGRIEVKLEIGDDGRMRAHMVVEKAETLDLLQRDQRQLERTMAQNGMKGFEDGLSFSLKDQGTGQGSYGNGKEGGGSQASFAGGSELEAANDPAPVQYRQMRVGGVDLSV